MERLDIFFNAIDATEEMSDYTVDTFTEAFTGGGFIYIGFRKPINSIYLGLSTPSDAKLSIQAFRFTTTFEEMDIIDRTSGLTRSGFIKWDRSTGQENKTTVNGLNRFWYRIDVPEPTAELVFTGVNIVFSDYNDLKEEFPNITEYLPTGQQSFIGFHQAARKQIIQTLSNRGRRVYGDGPKKIDQWDLLNFSEIRQAAKFLALSKLFFWLSDQVDDKWHQHARSFMSLYGQQFENFFLSIDKNDDGLEQVSEKQALSTARIIRA